MRPLSGLALLLAAIPVFAAPELALAASSATVQGRLTDEQGRPVAGAEVLLSNKTSGYRQRAHSDAQGRFTLRNIPLDAYHLEVAAGGLVTLHQEVELRTTLPVNLSFTLKSVGAEVVVEDTLGAVEEHASVHLDIDKSTLEKLPVSSGSKALEGVVLTAPGVVQDENGRFHVKGSHGQVTYVVDGVPVTDQVQSTFSNALDASQVESLEVLTGGIAAEYGGKPVAVVNLTSKSGLGTPNGFEGDVSAGASRFNTLDAAFGVRGGDNAAGYFVTGSLARSDRFLDPVNFENLHNHGESGRFFGRFDWVFGDHDSLRLSLSGGSSDRQVVNLASQEARGQDQRFHAGDTNLSAAWTHLYGENASLDATVFFRRATAVLRPTEELQPGFSGGGSDFPVWAEQDRRLDNVGLQLSYSLRVGQDTYKAGVSTIAYPIHERFGFAITDPSAPESTDPTSPLHPYTPGGGGNLFRFDGDLTPHLHSIFAQGALHRGAWTYDLGLRYDRYTVGGFSEGSLQPRLGASYRFTSGTVMRGSFDRLFITPENENLALSLSQQAWDLGPHAGTPVPPLRSERQDSYSIAVEQSLGKVARVSLEYWEKHSRNSADNNQFINTGIVFPIAAEAGLFHGLNLRFDLAEMNGFSAYLSLGKTRALFQAPVVGGLQLDAPEVPAGTRFLIDHDQKLSAQLGLSYQRKGFHADLDGRYDSGLVAGDPTAAVGNPDLDFGLAYVRFDSSDQVWRVKPRTVWDLGTGYTFQLAPTRKLDLGLNVLNLTDEKGLYNFLSTFGGTHVIPPRTFAVRVKYSF
ncbi:MAG TPA: TonB-dependent receptor [Holophagaceae bacterium]|nr:TonB-dependent receptor [Holophagaceae bacterium]